MVKKPTRLAVVSSKEQAADDIAGDSRPSFDLVALGQLVRSERDSVERLIAEICNNSGIVAVAKMTQDWDLRPVVAFLGEEQPSIIRLIHPDVSQSSNIKARLQDVFERLSRFEDLSSSICDWGDFEGQLWYRRLMVESALSDLLQSNFQFSSQETLSLAGNLVEEVAKWHSRGIVHGHIAPQNISVSKDGWVSLLDAGVAVSLIHASSVHEPSVDAFGYKAVEFAPEILSGQSVVYSADVYGLGRVIDELFLRLKSKRSKSKEADKSHVPLEAVLALSRAMTDEDVSRRPSLEDVQRFFKECTSADGKTEKPQSSAKDSEAAVPSRAWISEAAALDEDVKEAVVTEQKQAIEEIEEPSIGEVAPELKSEQDRPKLNLPFVLLLGLGLLIIFWIIRNSSGSHEQIQRPVYTNEQLVAAWETRLPTRMAEVALAALDSKSPNPAAEALIIDSAMGDAELPAGINKPLLRVAFDQNWELDLSAEDRRIALAFGLMGFLKDKTPADLSLEGKLHPGVVLAVAASVQGAAVRALNKIPASVLVELPPPTGPAFAALLRGAGEVSCGDEGVRIFAKLATGGMDSTTGIADFLNTDTERRLRATAVLFSFDNRISRDFLRILMHHPNISVDSDSIRWAKTWDLLNWKELESGDQLLVLGGILPQASVKAENIRKLFAHPSSELRSYALGQAFDKMKFKHPAALAVLKKIKENPESLTAEQTYLLMPLLEAPSKVKAEDVNLWLKTEPPLALAAGLVLSTAGESKATLVDSLLSVYLKKSDWEPNIEKMRKLSFHPDSYTRLYAYTEIFQLKDRPVVRDLLKAAKRKERSPELIEQLESMLLALGENS